MWPNPQFPARLVTFTGKILNAKLIFCAVLFALDLSSFVIEKTIVLVVIAICHNVFLRYVAIEIAVFSWLWEYSFDLLYICCSYL